MWFASSLSIVTGERNSHADFMMIHMLSNSFCFYSQFILYIRILILVGTDCCCYCSLYYVCIFCQHDCVLIFKWELDSIHIMVSIDTNKETNRTINDLVTFICAVPCNKTCLNFSFPSQEKISVVQQLVTLLRVCVCVFYFISFSR